MVILEMSTVRSIVNSVVLIVDLITFAIDLLLATRTSKMICLNIVDNNVSI